MTEPAAYAPSPSHKTSFASLRTLRKSPRRTTSFGHGLNKMKGRVSDHHSATGLPRQGNSSIPASPGNADLVHIAGSSSSSEDDQDAADFADDFESIQNAFSPRKHARTSSQQFKRLTSPLKDRATHQQQHASSAALGPLSPNSSSRRRSLSSSKSSSSSSMMGLSHHGVTHQRMSSAGAATAPPGERRSKFDMSRIKCDLPNIHREGPAASFPSAPSSMNPLAMSSDSAKHSRSSSLVSDSDACQETEGEEDDLPSPFQPSRADGGGGVPMTMPAAFRGKQARELDMSALKKSAPAPPLALASSDSAMSTHRRAGSHSSKPPAAAWRSSSLFSSHPTSSSSKAPSFLPVPNSGNPNGNNNNGSTNSTSNNNNNSNTPSAGSGGNRSHSRRRTGSDASAGAAYLESLDEDRSNEFFAPRDPCFSMLDASHANVFGSGNNALPRGNDENQSPFISSTPKRERSETSSPALPMRPQTLFSPARKANSMGDLFTASSEGLKASQSPWLKSSSTPNVAASAAGGGRSGHGRKRNSKGAIVSGAKVGSVLGANSPMVPPTSSPEFGRDAPGVIGASDDEDFAPDDDYARFAGEGTDEEMLDLAGNRSISPLGPWRAASPPPHVPALTDSSSIASSLASSRDSSRSLRSSLSSSASGSGNHQNTLHGEPKIRRSSEAFWNEGNSSFSASQSFSNVKPLAAAFASQGLASKKGKAPRDSGVALDSSSFSFSGATDNESLSKSYSGPPVNPAAHLMRSTKAMPDTPVKPSPNLSASTDMKQARLPRKSGLSESLSPVPASPAQGTSTPNDKSPARSSLDSPGSGSTSSGSPCTQAGTGKKAMLQQKQLPSKLHRPTLLFRRRSSGQLQNDMPAFIRSTSVAGEAATDAGNKEPMTPTRNVNKNGLFIKVPPLADSPRRSPSPLAQSFDQQASDRGDSSPLHSTPVSSTFPVNSVPAYEPPTAPSAPAPARRPSPNPLGGSLRPPHPPPTERRPSFKQRHSGSSLVTLKQLASQENERFEANYQVLGVLGQGISSEAFAVRDRGTGQVSAVKRTRVACQGPKERARRLEEVDILRQLCKQDEPSPFIINLFDAWEQNGHLHINTELCEHGNLSEFLASHGQNHERLDEARVWKIAFELSEGLSFIHVHQVLHLDLKPANVFITQTGSLKIGDFGLATRWPLANLFDIVQGAGVDVETFASNATNRPRARSVGMATTTDLEREGDREYIAPEVLRGVYGKPADVFSLGLSLLESAANVVLPDNGTSWHKLRSNDFSDVDFSHSSAHLVALLQGLLQADPHLRLSIRDALESPLLKELRQRYAAGILSTALVEEPPEFLQDLMRVDTVCDMELD